MNTMPVTPETLAHLSPLNHLGASGLRQAAQLARREFVPHDLSTRDFPWHSKVAYLLKGEIKLDYPDGGMRVIVGGSPDAQVPLGCCGASPARLRVITDADLLWFDESALDILVTWDQLVPPAAPAASDWRSMPGMFDVRRLTQSAFATLPAAHIESLLACFRQQPVKAGEVVVRQGDPGDCYFLIERGRAQVTREVGGANIDLAELQAGDAFGEEALIAETSRNATVTMKTDGELLRLDGSDFIRLLREPLLQRIDAAEARRRAAAGARWIDVRFPAEYRSDGIPGALNIPLNELRDSLAGLSRNEEYIVYCQTGRRSSAAAFLLSQHGINASLLEGGLKSMHAMEKRPA
jgi:rhodanese-related sulfurtransferase